LLGVFLLIFLGAVGYFQFEFLKMYIDIIFIYQYLTNLIISCVLANALASTFIYFYPFYPQDKRYFFEYYNLSFLIFLIFFLVYFCMELDRSNVIIVFMSCIILTPLA
jgi:hypothetical protein